MSGTSLGGAVLTLSTNQAPLRQGLTEARAETLRQTLEMKNAARIDLRANLDKLKLDFGQAVASARAEKRTLEQEATFAFRLNLAQLQSDLRTAEREHAASLKRIQDQERQAAQQSGGGLLSGLGGDIATGLGIGSGAAIVRTAIGGLGTALGAGKSAFIDYNSQLDNTRAQLLAFTGSAAQAEHILTDLRTEADKTPFTFQQLSGSIATLIPVAKQTGQSLQSLIKLAETLAALNPVQGFEGAAIALQNAAAGQSQSLQERFNISRVAITKFKEQGLSDLDAVRAALKAMGVDESIVANLSQTFAGRLSNLQDALNSLASRAGQPIFDELKRDLLSATTFLTSPEAQKAGAEFTKGIADGVAALRATLTDPQTKQGLVALASGLKDSAVSAGELAKALGAISGGTAIGALQIFGKLAKDLTDLEKHIDGTDKISRILIATLTGGLPKTVFELAAEDLRKLNDELNKPSLQKGLDDLIARLTKAIGGAKIIDLDPNRIGLNPAAAPQLGPPVPTQAPPQATLPPTEAQFDITAQKNEGARQAQLFEQGRKDLQAYLRGFSSQDFDLFAKIGPQIRASFDRAFGDLDIAQQFAHGLGDIDGLTARIVKDIDTIGHTSAETNAAVRNVFGDGADEVLRLADAYGTLARDAGVLLAATVALGAAQGTLNVVMASAATQIAAAEHAVTVAQGTAQTYQQQFQNQVDDLQRSLSAIDREAQQVGRAYDDQLRGLQSALTASQRAAEDAQRGFQARIEQAQKDQAAIQAAGEQHAAAFAAILNGTTDEFLHNKQLENEALDDQTRKILEQGQAYTELARQQDAANHAVRALDEREHQIQLDFDRRIQAARDANKPGQVAALTRERDRVLARERASSQVTRDEAVVAGDKAGDARTGIEQAAAAQAEVDKVAATAAAKRVAAIQDEAQARAEADRVAQQALADQITGVQEQARAAAQMYADRKQAIADEIAAVQERARQQKVADDAAILGAQTALGLVKQIEQSRIDAATKGVENAQGAANAAKAEYDWQVQVLAQMKLQNDELDTYITKWKEYIAYLKSQGINVPAFFGGGSAPPPRDTTVGGQPGTGLGDGGSGTGGGGGFIGGGTGGGGAPAPPAPAPSGGGGGGGGFFDPGGGGTTTPQAPDGGGGGASYPAGTLEKQIAIQTGDRRVKLAMLMGALVEGGSWDGPWGAGDGGRSFGPFQIYQDAHPDVTRAQAEDPAFAVRYMLGQYEAGVAQEGDKFGANPQGAAAAAIYLAERPFAPYPEDRIAAAFAQARSHAGYWQGGPIDERIVGIGTRTGTAYEFGERGREWVIPDAPAMPRYLPPVPPDIAAPSLTGGAYAAALSRGGTAIDTGAPGGAGQVHLHVAGPLLNVEHLDVNDRAQKEAFFREAEERFMGTHLEGLDAAKRGNVVGWSRGSGR